MPPRRPSTKPATSTRPAKTPVKKEPVKKEPVKKEPVKKEPVKKEPVKKESNNAATALLAAVIAEPDDDAPRLVYADHLSSAGDPRGEFIQIQCMLRRRLWGADGRSGAGKDDPSPPNAEQLRAREQELFKTHAKMWLASARPYIQIWCWRRGFLDIVETNAKFLPGAAQLLAEHPIHLNLSSLKPADLAGLATADLHGLRGLELITRSLNNTTVRGLLGKNLAGLQTLITMNTALRAEGVVALARDSHLTGLRSWSLEGGSIGAAGAAAIAASPVLRNLRVLSVRNTDIDATGVAAIARSSQLPALRTVVLGEHAATTAGPDAVAELARRCEVITDR